MPRRGRSPRLVHQVAEDWPIGKLGQLPEMRGVYVLYDRHHQPLHCGESGKGRQTIPQRIYIKSREKYKGAKVLFFSAYDVDIGIKHQLETLLLHAFANVLPHDTNRGRWPKTTEIHYPE